MSEDAELPRAEDDSSAIKQAPMLPLVLDATGFLLLAFLVSLCAAFLIDESTSSLGMFAVWGTGCAATAALVRERAKRHEVLSPERLGWRTPTGSDVAWALGAAVITRIITASWIGLDLPTAEQGPVEFLSMSRLGTASSIAFMFGALAARAVFEELVFRSYLLPRLESVAGTGAALVISSILFGLIHLGSAGMHTLTGLVWGYCFLRTRSVVAVSLAHVLHNVSIMVYAYVLILSGSG